MTDNTDNTILLSFSIGHNRPVVYTFPGNPEAFVLLEPSSPSSEGNERVPALVLARNFSPIGEV